MNFPRFVAVLLVGAVLPHAASAAGSAATIAIDAIADQFIAMAEASEPEAVFSNFGDGQHYVAFASRAAYEKALAAFKSGGSGDDSGSFVAKVYRDTLGDRYITFDSCTRLWGTPNSRSRSETALYNPAGRLIRVVVYREGCNDNSCGTTDFHSYYDANGKRLLFYGLGGRVVLKAGAAAATPVVSPKPEPELDFLPVYMTVDQLPFPLS
jgi:hypothetical protein